MPDSETISLCNVRAALRRVTAPGYQLLHMQPELNALAQGKLTRTGYTRLLPRLLGLHAPIELWLDQMAAQPLLRWRAALPIDSRVQRLVRDLRALGAGAAATFAAFSTWLGCGA
jgi:heme oxygenase